MWGAPYFGREFQAKLRRPGPGGYQKLSLFITRYHLCWLLLATRAFDGSPKTGRPAHTIANPAFYVRDFGSPTAPRMLPDLSALKYEVLCGSLEFPHRFLKRFPNHTLIRLLVRRL
jgi:hypothetical protein